MEFFGIGPFEVLLILLVAFIIIGPQRLLEVSRKASKTIGEWSRSMSDLNTKVQGEMKDKTSQNTTDNSKPGHSNSKDGPQY